MTPYSGYAGDTVVVKGKWQVSTTIEATCSGGATISKFYALYEDAEVDPKTGDIYCVVPEREDGVEDTVKVTVQVWDSKFAEGKQSNVLPPR